MYSNLFTTGKKLTEMFLAFNDTFNVLYFGRFLAMFSPAQFLHGCELFQDALLVFVQITRKTILISIFIFVKLLHYK